MNATCVSSGSCSPPRRRGAWSALILAVGLPWAGPVVAQSGTAAAPPLPPVKADSVRDTLTRPPDQHPLTVGAVVSYPLELMAMPLDLALTGTAELLGRLAGSGVHRPFVRAYRDLAAVNVTPGLTTGLGQRGGLATGVTWQPVDLLRLESSLSIRGYQDHGLRAAGTSGTWSLAGEVSYRRFTQERFWGLGMDAPEGDRAAFGERGWTFAGEVNRDLPGGLSLVLEGRWRETRLASTNDPRSPPLSESFSPAQLPLLASPAHIASLGGGVRLDALGHGELSPSGVELEARWWSHRGVRDTDVDFDDLRFSARVELPLSSHHLLSLRARSRDLMNVDGQVPFTYLPFLGGGTLRSYDAGRFRGRSLAAASAEFRWELVRDLRERGRVEALLFADHGAVGPTLDELSGARTSWGFGFTARWLRGLEATAFVAWGDEGARIAGSVSTAVGGP